jgi:hypothetical protein
MEEGDEDKGASMVLTIVGEWVSKTMSPLAETLVENRVADRFGEGCMTGGRDVVEDELEEAQTGVVEEEVRLEVELDR